MRSWSGNRNRCYAHVRAACRTRRRRCSRVDDTGADFLGVTVQTRTNRWSRTRTGEMQQALTDAGVESRCRTQQPVKRKNRFSKAKFNIDLDADTVTCPNKVTVTIRRSNNGTNGTAAFGDACGECPLREACTTSNAGRTISVGQFEAALAISYRPATTDRQRLAGRLPGNPVQGRTETRAPDVPQTRRTAGQSPRPNESRRRLRAARSSTEHRQTRRARDQINPHRMDRSNLNDQEKPPSAPPPAPPQRHRPTEPSPPTRTPASQPASPSKRRHSQSHHPAQPSDHPERHQPPRENCDSLQRFLPTCSTSRRQGWSAFIRRWSRGVIPLGATAVKSPRERSTYFRGRHSDPQSRRSRRRARPKTPSLRRSARRDHGGRRRIF